MPGRAPSIRRFRFTSGFTAGITSRLTAALAVLALPWCAAAQDLFQVYRDAQSYDAVYAAARHSLEAGRERLPQGRALLLPTLNLSSQASRTRNELDSRDPLILPSVTRYPETASYTLTFTQPLFRYQNWIQYEQAGHQVRQAEAVFGQAYQDLIVRVAQAYFDVLAAQDTLALVRAQREAISEQLAQAKRNFEVGTATITDTHEAQARYDLSGAQEIAAQNDLESKRRALQLLTGKETGELKPLRADIQPHAAQPERHADLGGHRREAELPGADRRSRPPRSPRSKRKRNTAAHLPTLDFFATHGQTGAERDHRQRGRARHHADRDRPAARHAAVPGRRAHLARPRERGAGHEVEGRPGERAAQRRALRAAELPRGDQRHRPGRARWSRRWSRRRARSTRTSSATRSACASTSTC